MAILHPFTASTTPEAPKLNKCQRWEAKQKEWKEERRKIIGTPRSPKKTRTRAPGAEEKRMDEIALRDEKIREGRE